MLSFTSYSQLHGALMNAADRAKPGGHPGFHSETGSAAYRKPVPDEL
jgi:hypothetical protein